MVIVLKQMTAEITEYCLSTLAIYVEREKLSCMFSWENMHTLVSLYHPPSLIVRILKDGPSKLPTLSRMWSGSTEEMVSEQIHNLFSSSSSLFAYIFFPFPSSFSLSSSMVSTSGIQKSLFNEWDIRNVSFYILQRKGYFIKTRLYVKRIKSKIAYSNLSLTRLFLTWYILYIFLYNYFCRLCNFTYYTLFESWGFVLSW